jgi:hypothetical protein
LIPPLDRAQIFPQAVFLRVAMEWLLNYEDVWSVELDYRLKRSIAFDPIVRSRSNFYRVSRGCFNWVAMEWLLRDEDVWSVELEYRIKRAITFDPTVGLRSKFSISCFPWGSYGMATR